MGSIEYILENIVGVGKTAIELIQGRGLGGGFAKDHLGNGIDLFKAIFALDSASSKNLGSAPLHESNPGSIESFFSLSSKPEEAAKTK